MNIIARYYKVILLLIPFISLLMHFHVFKLDLVGYHVWRQTETQTVINNFYKEDLNILHPKINDHADTDRIMRMEFPIMQWLFALFFKIFGDHIIISRILSFIIGLFSVYGIFYLCDHIFHNKIIATIGAWAFNFSPLFYYYTVNPLPDNFALCCAIWSGGLLFAYKDTHKITYAVISAVLLCLATLAKLPFILYGIVPCMLFILNWRYKSNSRASLIKFAAVYLIFIIPAFVWYLWVIPGWGGNIIIKGVFDSKNDFYHLLDMLQGNIVSTLPELLLNYGSVIFFIAGFYFLFKLKTQKKKYFSLFLAWGLSVVLYFLYELNAIGTVHDYYMFPFLPLLFILVAFGAYHLLISTSKALRFFSLFALCILPVTAFLRADSRWNPEEPLFNPVYYQYKTELRQLTPPNALCIVGNDYSHYILLYYIDRKGWAFDTDHLSGQELEYDMSKDATYLFTDSPVDTITQIKNHLAEKIFEKGTVRVYKLR